MNIDLIWLKENSLTPDEYVYLMHMMQGETPVCKLNIRAKYLEERGFIKIREGDLILRDAFRELVTTDFKSAFAQLVGTYPFKVGVGSDVRVLHALDPDASSNKVARDRYRKVLEKDPTLHSDIMRALDTQLSMQRNKLKFLPKLEVWINKRSWEGWLDIDMEEEPNADGRITRTL